VFFISLDKSGPPLNIMNANPNMNEHTNKVGEFISVAIPHSKIVEKNTVPFTILIPLLFFFQFLFS
jgi:hypothetical protein